MQMNLQFGLQVFHYFSVFFMTGVIWIIQVVHYPLMKFTKEQSWTEFHQQHSARITWIVGPVMLLELSSAFFMADKTLICAGLSIFVFVITGLISVPRHNRLATGYSASVLKSLVQTNWLRTIAWSLHSAFLLILLLF